MPKLTQADVTHIADLARLKLSPAETNAMQAQLSAILDYAEAIQSLNTDDVPPTTSAVPRFNSLRTDEAKPSLSNSDALSNAPDAADSSFRVKPILP